MNQPHRRHLPRLARASYSGHAAIFWTHTIDRRQTGWLGPEFHGRFREVLVHCCARYQLACPIYVLMPDHWHLVWYGMHVASDQWRSTRFLRRYVQTLLGTVRLQEEPYDHLLREHECDGGAFAATFEYIRQNPVRKQLCADWRDWQYLGSVIAGYPSLDPREPDFLGRFWRIYNEALEHPVVTNRATF